MGVPPYPKGWRPHLEEILDPPLISRSECDIHEKESQRLNIRLLMVSLSDLNLNNLILILLVCVRLELKCAIDSLLAGPTGGSKGSNFFLFHVAFGKILDPPLGTVLPCHNVIRIVFYLFEFNAGDLAINFTVCYEIKCAFNCYTQERIFCHCRERGGGGGENYYYPILRMCLA